MGFRGRRTTTSAPTVGSPTSAKARILGGPVESLAIAKAMPHAQQTTKTAHNVKARIVAVLALTPAIQPTEATTAR